MKKHMLILALACGTFSTSKVLAAKEIERGPEYLSKIGVEVTEALGNIAGSRLDPVTELRYSLQVILLQLSALTSALQDTQRALDITDSPRSKVNAGNFGQMLRFMAGPQASNKHKPRRRRRRA